MPVLEVLAHLVKYGVANLDEATLNHLYQRATDSVAQLEAHRAELPYHDFDEAFGPALRDSQQAQKLIEDFRAGRPVPDAVAPAAVVLNPPQPKEDKWYILEHFYRPAFEAYTHISHSPERRARTIVEEYSGLLEADFARLKAADVDEEKQKEYQKGFEQHLRAYLGAKSRTASPMITGPANFPVERNRKAMNSERKRFEEFEEFRRKALSRAINGPRVPRTPTSELEKCQAKLATYERNHELMLNFNKMLRKEKSSKAYKTSGEDEGAMVGRIALAAGLSQELATELISYRRHSGSFGFPGFHLTNNKAEINRLKGRVIELSAKVEIYAEDRIQIVLEERPSNELKEKLKRRGFRWAPSQGAWQRQLTRNAIGDAKEITDTWNTYGK
jgi:hypothetical protein